MQELKEPSIKITLAETAKLPQIDAAQEVLMTEVDWRETFIKFIMEKRFPPGVNKDSAEATRIMRRSKGLVVVRNKLYKRGAHSGVLMKCVLSVWGRSILQEIHEGSYGNHAASKALVGKAFRAGFWWPTALSDAEDMVRKCQKC